MPWFCPRCGHEAEASGPCARDGEPLVRVSSHDLCGRRLGEYMVLAHLGGGSFGKVYRAVHARSGMLVAIKLLHRPIDHAESKRVLVEARAAAMVNHPNVVKVHDLAYASDRRPYIVMQLLEGRSLAKLLAAGPMPIDTALKIAADVLAGLAAAHATGIVHRDLKPDNIFVTAAGTAIVVDFGLAKLVADPRMPTLTMTGEAIGTPTYMAPEQIRGGAIDGRADLYAFACVLFEMLAGRPPFSGTTYALFDAHLEKPPAALATLRADVPPHVAEAIAHALAKAAEARFPDATTMRRALTGKRGTSTGRRLWPLALAAVAVVGGVVAIAAVTGGGDSTESAAAPATPSPAPAAGSNAPLATGMTKGTRSSGSAAAPPARPDEPALDGKLEQTLATVAASFARGDFPRTAAVAQRCELERANQLAGYPEHLRAFNRKYIALIDRYFQIDLESECGAAASQARVPARPPRRHPLPPPLDDEPALDANMELALSTIHDQLDADRVTRSMALSMLCGIYTTKDEARRDRRLHPLTRAFYRRYERLLRSYYPDLDAAECR